MESRAGNTADPRGSRGGGGLPGSGGPRARQLLERLDARPLAARAAADFSELVRKASATLRLRHKEAVSILDSADIEVTDSRLPHTTLVEHRSQHRRSETLGTYMEPPPVTQHKASYTLKLPQATRQFSVELVRGPAGFGFTLKGGRGVSGDVPLAVRGLLKDGPAHRCGRLQAGDLVLHINGESTQGLTHAQVVERIRAGGPRLCLVLRRPQERDASKTEEVGGHQKRDCSPDPRGSRMTRSRSTISPVHQTLKSRTCLEPSPEAVAAGHVVPIVEHPAEDLKDHIPGAPGTPGPWLVPSEDRLSQALGVRGGGGGAQIAQEMAAGKQRH
ncbi:PDZ domain-containing protein MAGIX [Cricetulus griseus]|uniref:MAGI family member, X-linked n=1 Tax=Cricetulus griseus TaxID=10029 RepID=A0A8C2QIG0_CRIGR|nr:PDZ domain-containing protein MAGIX [Cricetulus griseus]XP_027294273.1 PDZ domain-containing protein MAGIX [Cricetulus griseus]